MKFIFLFNLKFFFDATLFLFFRSLKMWDRQEILQFVQRNHELYYIAWERYKDLLRDFPYHGFNREGQLMNLGSPPQHENGWKEELSPLSTISLRTKPTGI